MVSRRRWRGLAILTLVAAVTVPAFGAAAPAVNPAAAAKAMATAPDDAEKARIGRDLLDAVRRLPDRREAAKEIAKEFLPLTNDPNSGTSLNAAIVIARTDHLNVDAACIAMVANKDAAVRYWGARGLTDIASSVIAVSPRNAVNALRAALAKPENSGVVAAELVNALNEYNDYAATLEGLDHFSKLFEKSVPDVNMLSAATKALVKIGTQTASKPAAEKELAATVSARLASFTAQQYNAAAKAAADVGGLPTDYTNHVNRLLDAATKVAAAGAGVPLKTPTGATPDELQMNMGSIFGSPAGNKGTLQNTMAKVPVPGPISVPGQP
jgi:hypothetical protein